MSVVAPRLTIGLPTYNGEAFLDAALTALRAQTYDDVEILLSDNASTDRTAEIARDHAAADRRIRYVRQPVNIGAVPNHNWCIDQARGELFKWASDDDLYAPDLVERCVAALEERPEVVLAHAWTATVDSSGTVVDAPAYPLDTDNPAPARFRSLLMDSGGDDIYGVIRRGALARLRHGSYHQADRVFTGTLGLHGPFHQVPEHLYFRREHEGRTSRAPDVREHVARFDPRRRNRWRHPRARLLAEYVGGYVAAIRRAPLSAADRARCLAHLGAWAADRAAPLVGCSRRGGPDEVAQMRWRR